VDFPTIARPVDNPGLFYYLGSRRLLTTE
jgi:hypothetical protein